ncbi:MAG: hypothetical protein K0U93_13050 [Gammaproteobacteria bacterium]|nr:hypothetical protein [Gammaproteobacteria bacterium]
MNLTSTRRILLYSVLIGLVAGRSAADDTEVFSPSLPPAQQALLKPNVLFIMDTSGSMGATVPSTPPPYDPAVTYAGSCLASRIYWSTNQYVPTCTTSQYFEASKNRCAASTAQLATGGAGFYQDRFARFQYGSKSSKNKWQRLGTSSSTRNPPHVECRNDNGVHGLDATSSDKYIQKGNSSPWKSSSSGALNWNKTGRFYTVYSANYVNWFRANVTANPTRIQVAKTALSQIIAANSQNIFAGLMRFDTKTVSAPQATRGGPVIFPVSDISSAAAEAAFQSAVSGLSASSWTPLSETMYEAMLYYRGETPYFGTNPPFDNNIQSVPGSLQGSKYKSPIAHECQKNYIVYLTDGEPTYDSDANAKIAPYLAGANPKLSDQSCAASTGVSGGDNCLDEVAEFLATNDNSTGFSGKQTVKTYTVGFLNNFKLLQDTARKGNGKYYTANDALQLSQAFTSILADIHEVDSTFSAPSVSVNAFNRITNRKELFFSLFLPSERQRWPGNIKRFQLDCRVPDPNKPGYCADGGDADSDPDLPEILDADGLPAVDPVTGFFKTTSRSVWTPTAAGPDGANTELGGAAHVIGGLSGADDPPTRVVYTYTGGYTNNNGAYVPSGTKNLAATSNLLVDSNAAVTTGMFFPAGQQTGDPTRTELINWTRGVDLLDFDQDGSTTDSRHQLGDALHTKPVLFDYGTSANAPDLTLFTINNDGYLHAIDVDDGSEVFSFVPQELLQNMPNLYADNPASAGVRPYGLDGPMTLWFEDKPTYDVNGNLTAPPDGVLQASNGEHIYLIFGQRRGGNQYFAVEVTDRSAPKLVWKIVGGVGDFAELGQTWSAPVRAKVKVNGTAKDVLVFSAGYDVSQDTAVTPQNDTVGRAIFMVDARTGQKIWTAGPSGMTPTPNLVISEMTNSIPSTPNVFDITGDGYDDRIYVGDTRAQLFRIDINNDNVGLSGNGSGQQKFAVGARVATLQKKTSTSTPGAQDNRRFFYRPDVSFAAPADASPFLAVAIGSGYRAHPLNTDVRDRFYMLRDPKIGVITDPSEYPANPYTEDDLLDITNNLTPTSGQLTGTPSNPTIGWYLRLANSNGSGGFSYVGEKVLAESVTFGGTILFSTFTPPVTPLTPDCLPNQGDGRLFAVNVYDGSPVQDLDDSGSTTLTKSDRHVDLIRSGIPPGVTILFSPTNGVTPIAIVATETMPVNLTITPVKTYWYQTEE